MPTVRLGRLQHVSKAQIFTLVVLPLLVGFTFIQHPASSLQTWRMPLVQVDRAHFVAPALNSAGAQQNALRAAQQNASTKNLTFPPLLQKGTGNPNSIQQNASEVRKNLNNIHPNVSEDRMAVSPATMQNISQPKPDAPHPVLENKKVKASEGVSEASAAVVVAPEEVKQDASPPGLENKEVKASEGVSGASAAVVAPEEVKQDASQPVLENKEVKASGGASGASAAVVAPEEVKQDASQPVLESREVKASGGASEASSGVAVASQGVKQDKPSVPVSAGEQPDKAAAAGALTPPKEAAKAQPKYVLTKGNKVLVFTMDSLEARVADSSKGGPMGEALVRKPLVKKLEELGFTVKTATSDQEFEKELRDTSYQLFVVDPWTWAKKGFVPKGRLGTQAGIGKNTFVLDFFGDSWQTEKAVNIPGFDPKTNALTMFPKQPDYLLDEAFLGFGFGDPTAFWGTTWEDVAGFSRLLEQKKQTNEIVVWAKDPGYLLVGSTAAAMPRFEYLVQFCEAFAEQMPTRTSTLAFSFSPDGSSFFQRAAKRAEGSTCKLRFQGHAAKEVWRGLLRKAAAVVGVMDPLAGPTAIEGLVAGALYVNPRMSKQHAPWKSQMDKGASHSSSQHTFLERFFERNGQGEHRICNVAAWDPADVKRCAREAASRLALRGEEARALFRVPPPFDSEVYTQRVRRMFGVELTSTR